jgi:hypothetical protein
VEEITKPITTVKNLIKKATGKEVEAPKEKSKHRLWLDEKVKQIREERINAKQAKKQERLQIKAQKRQERLAKKQHEALPEPQVLQIEHKDEQN